MAWRFKTSKFKNTVPHMPKKADTIYDLPLSSVSTTNNGIIANQSLYAFHIEGDAGKLGILPLTSRGRKLKQNISIICAHTESVQDLTFLPFSPNLLVTCAKDDMVKIWELDPNGNTASVTSEPVGRVDNRGCSVECLAAHPNADNIVAAGHHQGIIVIDVHEHTAAVELSLEDCERMHSVSWNGNGRTLAASCKNGSVAVFDPRAQTTSVNTISAHSGMGREGRVLWLGDEGKLLSSGFTKTKNREIVVYDERNWATPFVTQQHQPSTGILMPLYDPDTKLIFLAGKGSNKLMIYEITERDPYLAEVATHNAPEQTIGCCLQQKRSLNVMQAEVDVFVQMTKTSIVPVSCNVIRTNYRDFISDLFPETVCGLAGCEASEWLGGSDSKPPKFSLDPAKKDLIDVPPSKRIHTRNASPPPIGLGALRNKGNKVHHHEGQNGNLDATVYFTPPEQMTNGHTRDQENESPDKPTSPVNFVKDSPFRKTDREKPPTSPKPVIDPPKRPLQHNLPKLKMSDHEAEDQKEKHCPSTLPPEVKVRTTAVAANPEARKSSWNRPVTSKYKHTKVNAGLEMGKVMFTNIRHANLNMPNESDAFCVSGKWAAIPMTSGATGTIAILQLERPNKLPDGVIHGLENCSKVNDMVWCPFDDDQIACGCDNGVVNIWTVEGALLSHPKATVSFAASSERVLIIRYHPTAEDLLAVVAGNDVALWDLQDTSAPHIKLQTHPKPVISLTWSPFGNELVTICKDLNLNVYEPRKSTAPVQSKTVLEKMGHARSFYACSGRMLCVSHHTRSMKRVLSLYTASNLQHVHTETIGDSSASLLIPSFDFDTNIVFLAAKGDRLLHMFEVHESAPWMLPIQSYTEAVAHQGIAMHAKNACDVTKIQIAKGWILTHTNHICTLKRLVFTVPRRDPHLFASELFPEALVTWKSVTSAKEWFHSNGATIPPNYMSLKPENMEVSNVAAPVAAPRQPSSLASAQPVAAPRCEPDPLDSVASKPTPLVVFGEKQSSHAPQLDDDEAEKRVKLVDSLKDVADTMDIAEKEMEQDKMEGVDPEEWDENDE